MITKSEYAIEDDFSPLSSPLDPQSLTLADRKNRNTLKSPKQVELFNAVSIGDVAKVEQTFYSGIDMKLGSRENRAFTKLLLGTAIENDNDEILKVNHNF